MILWGVLLLLGQILSYRGKKMSERLECQIGDIVLVFEHPMMIIGPREESLWPCWWFAKEYVIMLYLHSGDCKIIARVDS